MELFKSILYLLAVITSLACTLLLFRAYFKGPLRILLWSALCFTCLTINNILLFVDIVVLPTEVDLRVIRHVAALAGMVFLIYGFIYDSD